MSLPDMPWIVVDGLALSDGKPMVLAAFRQLDDALEIAEGWNQRAFSPERFCVMKADA